jgi:peptidoglycan hydrolase CwlO-like protein
MNITNVNELNQDLPEPSSIFIQLTSLNQQFTSLLDDFKKYYILHNLTPQSNEYSQMFSIIKGNVQKIISHLFSETNSIESVIEKINTILMKLNTEIQEEKLKNTAFKQKLHIVKNTNSGASEMIKNYKTMYNLQYFSNFTMILGIFAAGIMTSKVFKKR